MNSCKKIEAVYEEVKKDLNNLLYGENHTETNLLIILDKLTFEKNFSIYENNQYDLDEISKIFRFYEDTLKNYHEDDKCIFEWFFKCYTIVVKVFTELCLVFSINKEKRDYIYTFLQILKESNNMVKFFIPLDERYIKILNNLIGEQLYYFSHLEYKEFRDKDIEYILDYYFLSLEKQYHGFELSSLSEFGNKEFVDEKSEYMIFMNNVAFLLLKLIYMLKIDFKNITFFENRKFIEIFKFYKKISELNKDATFESIQSIEECLIEEFLSSNKYLNNNKQYNVLDEKIKLLQINTDEYKQLIDIILMSKQE